MNLPELNLRKVSIIAAQGLVITIMASSLVLLFTSSGDTLQQFRDNVRWHHSPLLILPVFLSWSCNGSRFYMMCRCLGHRISWRRALAIAVSSEFGALASPGGVGGAAIRLGFLKKSGVPFVHSGALLAADVFLNMVFFSVLTPFALYSLLSYRSFNEAPSYGAWNPVWLLVLLIPTMLILTRKRLYSLICRQRAFQKYRLGSRIRLFRKKMLHGVRQGRTAVALIFRNHRGALAVNLALTAVQFCSRYSILPIAIWLLGIEINPIPLIVMQGALYVISMVLVAPGGGGSVEVLAAVALPQLMPVNLVGIAILLWRLFTYHFYLIVGGSVFAVTFRKLMRN